MGPMRMDVDVRRGPGMGMEMGPGMGMGMGPGMGRGMGMGMGMHRGGGHEMGLEWAINNPKLREQLLITPEQVVKIRQEALNFRKTEILSRADLEVKRLELDSLLEAETPDRAAIDKSLRAANAAQFTVEKAAIDHQLAVRDLVTPEQRKKLEKMREEFRGPGAGPGGPGGPRGMTHPGGNVFYMRQDGGGIMHPGGNGMMRPNVEKTIIMRDGEATAMPARPSRRRHRHRRSSKPGCLRAAISASFKTAHARPLQPGVGRSIVSQDRLAGRAYGTALSRLSRVNEGEGAP